MRKMFLLKMISWRPASSAFIGLRGHIVVVIVAVLVLVVLALVLIVVGGDKETR
jgi:hypothetical protein